MTTSTIFLLLVAAASTIAFTPPEGVGSTGTGYHHVPAVKSYTANTGYQGGSAGYQGGSAGYQGGSAGYQGGSAGYQGYQGGGGGYQAGGGGYQGAGAGYQGGGGFGSGGQYPYYPTVHTAPVAQPFDFASLFRYLQQLQAIVQQQQRQHQLAFSGYAPGDRDAPPRRRLYSWHAATAGDPWRRTPSFAHSNAIFFNKGFGGYSDLDSNALAERFGAASGGGAAGGAYSGSFSGSGSGNAGFGAVPGFGSGFAGGNAGGQPFVFGAGGQPGFGGGYTGFGGGAGGGDGAVGAAASAAIGPQGGFQMASLFPDTGLASRFGGDVAPPSGNSFGVFTSSSSGSSDINGKKTSFKTATVGVNDNGKVTYKTVHDP